MNVKHVTFPNALSTFEAFPAEDPGELNRSFENILHYKCIFFTAARNTDKSHVDTLFHYAQRDGALNHLVFPFTGRDLRKNGENIHV